jgi:ribosomal protein S18 acetylase RimI-like enzyme
MLIRKYTNKDLPSLKKLVNDNNYWKFFTDKHYTKFLSFENNILIGVAVVSITLDTANLDFIFVREDRRSNNFGSKLVSTVEAYIKSKNAEGFCVNCGIENKKAQDFYINEGFKEVGKVFNYFSNNNMQIFFWKKI